MLQYRKFLFILLVLLASSGVSARQVTEIYISPDGALTFQYPQGWVIQEQPPTIVLASSQALIDEGFEAVPDGISITIFPVERRVLGNTEVEAAAHRFFELQLQALSGPQSATSLTEMTYGGQRVFQSIITSDRGQAIWNAVDVDGEHLLIIALVTRQENIEDKAALLENMLSTLTYDPGVKPANQVAVIGQVVWQQQDEIASVGRYREIEVAPDGMIYLVTDRAIHVLNADGQMERTLPGGGANGISDLEVAPDGTLWLADDVQKVIMQLDSEGNVLTRREFRTFSPDTSVSVFSPMQVEIGTDDRIYVLNNTSNQAMETETTRIQVFDTAMTLLDEFPINDENDPQSFRDFPTMALGSDQRLYIVSENYGIRVFDTAGNLISRDLTDGALTFEGLTAIDIDADGTLYVAGEKGGFFVLDSTGRLLSRFGTLQWLDDNEDAFATGEFFKPAGIAVLPEGDVLLVDNNQTYAQLVRVRLDPTAPVQVQTPVQPTNAVEVSAPVITETLDSAGCAVDTTTTLAADTQRFYVVSEARYFPAGSSFSVLLYFEGQPVEEIPPVTANQDYRQVCISAVFESEQFEPGAYKAELSIDGVSVNTVDFTIE